MAPRRLVAATVPRLAPGVAGSAFHPLMRLAYAVMAGDDEDVGIALGYWAATYLPLDAGGASPGVTMDPAEVLRRAAQLPGLAEASPESDLVWHNMRAVARVPSFAGVADWLIIRDDTLDRMAAASLALLAGNDELRGTPCRHRLSLAEAFCSQWFPICLRC